jgi:ElaB/YqjD/DUF883 family membrane-anchored ribosome-binding protein
MLASVFEKTTIAEDALHEASKITSAVTDVVKDKLRAANQQIRRGRNAAENMLEETKHTVKRRPIGSVAIAFVAGFLAGSILVCAVMPRHR